MCEIEPNAFGGYNHKLAKRSDQYTDIVYIDSNTDHRQFIIRVESAEVASIQRTGIAR